MTPITTPAVKLPTEDSVSQALSICRPTSRRSGANRSSCATRTANAVLPMRSTEAPAPRMSFLIMTDSLHEIRPICYGASVPGDVRDYVSVTEGVLPLWPTKVHEKEHPHVTADCDDREFSDGFCGGEGDAGGRSGVERGLSPARAPSAGGDHRRTHGQGGGSLAGWSGDRRPAGPAQRPLPSSSAERAGRDRACGAAHAALLPDRGAARLCPAHGRDRPRHPGRLPPSTAGPSRPATRP